MAIPTLIVELVAYWNDQGIDLNRGVDPQVLTEFERRTDVALPPLFRAYLSTVNGMRDSATYDKDMLHFWSLEEIEERGCFQTNDHGELYFVFADYSIHAHQYGLQLHRADPSTDAVCVVLGDKVEAPLYESFAEFLRVYLTDAVRVVMLRR